MKLDAREAGNAMTGPAMRRRVLCLLFALAIASAMTATPGVAAGDRDPLGEDLVPVPSLSPADVVKIQLEALRHNDSRNRGIEVAFRFASPNNRVNTGPLSRFIGMIRAGPYALMLGYREASYGPVETRGLQARQRVTLADATRSINFWFYLSRQSEAPYTDCWMTDAVYVESFAGQSA